VFVQNRRNQNVLNDNVHCLLCSSVLFVCLFVCSLVVELYDTAAMQAYCILTQPNEFRHSTPEAFHTKRRERPLLAKDGTKSK
jgi:hypothetical protein